MYVFPVNVCISCQCDKKEVRTKKWIKPGSPSHEALKNVVVDKVLMKDMEKMNKNIYNNLPRSVPFT